MAQAVPATPTQTLGLSYVDWPAIFAGAVLAAAIAFVFSTFGAAVGLSLASPFEGEGMSLTFSVIAVGIWVLWVSASSFMAGAYLTGRLRHRIPDATEHETDVRDGAHGLVVWAVGAVIGAVILGSGISTTAKVGSEVVGAAASAATAAGTAAAGEADGGELRYLVERLLRVPTDTSPATGDTEAVAGETQRILAANAGEEELDADDKAYLAELVARNTGLTTEEASTRVDQAFARLQEAEQSAREAAEAARKASVVAAFVLAAALLIGAAGAFWAASIGGRHRDKQTVVSWFVIR